MDTVFKLTARSDCFSISCNLYDIIRVYEGILTKGNVLLLLENSCKHKWNGAWRCFQMNIFKNTFITQCGIVIECQNKPAATIMRMREQWTLMTRTTVQYLENNGIKHIVLNFLKSIEEFFHWIWSHLLPIFLSLYYIHQ